MNKYIVKSGNKVIFEEGKTTNLKAEYNVLLFREKFIEFNLISYTSKVKAASEND